MCKDLIFCQFFFSRETRKLIAIDKFSTILSFFILTFPIVKPKHRTFFNSIFIDDFTTFTFFFKSSLCVIKDGNFPALFKPGPNTLGIVLMIESDARKKSYFFANFFPMFANIQLMFCEF